MESGSPPLPDLARDLREMFGERLQTLVAYATHAGGDAPPPAHGDRRHAAAAPARRYSLAVVRGLSADDLRACSARVARWHEAGLATPLVLAADEFARSLDAFPLEFGAIVADHEVIVGDSPFASMGVEPADLRRACEVQARSHLLHLRQGYLETLGNADALAVLVVGSAAPFAALLAAIARLQGLATRAPGAVARHVERALQVPGGTITGVVELAGISEIPAADATRIFPAYLDAVERLVRFVDAWNEKP